MRVSVLFKGKVLSETILDFETDAPKVCICTVPPSFLLDCQGGFIAGSAT